ncbi:antibiotic biosynthesis monooxygenase [Rhodobacteraceae bacterium NNCM2]|nr:antibiotic biosynthesis monooxygenase [Coraliihabitans acroporae]
MSAGPVIVAGFTTYEAGEVDRLKSEMEAVIEATRAEPGCRLYTFSRQVDAPDTIRIFEIWESEEALRAHFKTPHMAIWMGVLETARITDREVKVFPFSAENPASDYR